MRRKLTVILASDVAGYSRLVAADEEDTVHRFSEAARRFSATVAKYQGRVFNTAGDAILAEFDSAVDATRCAIEIQKDNNAQNTATADGKKLLFRIGIAVGDVLVAENGDLLGDGVNIAARLEGIAQPGGICISDDVRMHVLNKVQANFADLGEQSLRNIPRPVRTFILSDDAASAPAPPPASARRLATKISSPWLLAAVAILVVGLSAAAVRYARFATPAATPGAAAGSRLFDPAVVPLVTDRARGTFSDFAQQPDFKAIAISHSGWGVASGAADAVSAEREAIDRCKKRDQKGDCRIYAVGDKVVWPQLPLPLPADFRPAPSDAPLIPAQTAGIKGMPTVAGLEAFLKEGDHKALAISEFGFSSIASRPDQGEAIRLAVERCSDFSHTACLLVSVDGFLTVQIPHSYRAVQPYTLAGDADMSDADKQQIGEIYAGKDWRALARGGAKHWYAVSDMGSETAAVEQVLKACRAVEQDCVLRALGNFAVVMH